MIAKEKQRAKDKEEGKEPEPPKNQKPKDPKFMTLQEQLQHQMKLNAEKAKMKDKK